MACHYRLFRMLWACTFLIIAVVPAAQADTTAPRVRPVGGRVVALLARGYSSSQTLALLVDALERSDIIVHIEEQVQRDGPAGRTQFVAVAGAQRYLRIYLDARWPDDLAVGVLGHELQHAFEIARVPWVVDQETLALLYARIGYETDGRLDVRHMDSIPAQKAGVQVLKELRGIALRESDATD